MADFLYGSDIRIHWEQCKSSGRGGRRREDCRCESDLSADDLINNVSDLISRSGRNYYDAGVRFHACNSEPDVFGRRRVFRNDVPDDQWWRRLRKEVYDSEYYAGGCNEEDEEAAYNIVKNMAGQGVGNLCVINIAKGDTSSDLRDKAWKRGKETGINLLNTTYGIAAQTDMTKQLKVTLRLIRNWTASFWQEPIATRRFRRLKRPCLIMEWPAK